MVKKSIKVFARLKPSFNHQDTEVYNISHKKGCHEIVFKTDESSDYGFYRNSTLKYRFSLVLDQHFSQSDTFREIAEPVINSVLDGYNGTVFAYGQTGSGKTYSITGESRNYSSRGIIPRAIEYVFEKISKIHTGLCSVYISYMEIYNENAYDLLNPKHSATNLENLPKVILLEDCKGEIHLRNLSVVPVASEKEALNLLFMGDTNRTIAETPMNICSSRSHCIFTVHISNTAENGGRIRAKLHLVDLAGSERVKKTNLTGKLLNNSKQINLSLHYLEQVILALSEGRKHVPYRNSMMTSVLRDSLGGNCITVMIANISTESRNFQETISTCKFAQRVASITTEINVNEENDPRQEIVTLKMEIDNLKRQLDLFKGVQQQDKLTMQEIDECKALVFKYVDSLIPDLKFDGDMRKIQLYFQLFRNMIHSNQKDAHKNVEAGKTQALVDRYKIILKEKDEEILKLTILLNKIKKADRVSSSKSNNNPGLKITAPIAPKIEISQQNITNSIKPSFEEQPKLINQIPNEKLQQKNIEVLSPKSETKLFKKYYKNSQNREELEFYVSSLKNKSQEAQRIADNIEVCKNNIVLLKSQLDLHCHKNSDYTHKLIEHLKSQQEMYRMNILKLQQLKNETTFLNHGYDQAKIRLLQNFKQFQTQPPGKEEINTVENFDNSFIPSNYTNNSKTCSHGRNEVINMNPIKHNKKKVDLFYENTDVTDSLQYNSGFLQEHLLGNFGEMSKNQAKIDYSSHDYDPELHKYLNSNLLAFNTDEEKTINYPPNVCCNQENYNFPVTSCLSNKNGNAIQYYQSEIIEQSLNPNNHMCCCSIDCESRKYISAHDQPNKIVNVGNVCETQPSNCNLYHAAYEPQYPEKLETNSTRNYVFNCKNEDKDCKTPNFTNKYQKFHYETMDDSSHFKSGNQDIESSVNCNNCTTIQSCAKLNVRENINNTSSQCSHKTHPNIETNKKGNLEIMHLINSSSVSSQQSNNNTKTENPDTNKVKQHYSEMLGTKKCCITCKSINEDMNDLNHNKRGNNIQQNPTDNINKKQASVAIQTYSPRQFSETNKNCCKCKSVNETTKVAVDNHNNHQNKTHFEKQENNSFNETSADITTQKHTPKQISETLSGCNYKYGNEDRRSTNEITKNYGKEDTRASFEDHSCDKEEYYIEPNTKVHINNLPEIARTYSPREIPKTTKNSCENYQFESNNSRLIVNGQKDDTNRSYTEQNVADYSNERDFIQETNTERLKDDFLVRSDASTKETTKSNTALSNEVSNKQKNTESNPDVPVKYSPGSSCSFSSNPQDFDDDCNKICEEEMINENEKDAIRNFRDILKEIPLTGDAEVDEEIISFYKMKFRISN